MIADTLKNRKYVKEYDPDVVIPKYLIDSLLEKTWSLTPSKNNFMPYTIHVVGPEHQEYKQKIFDHCIATEAGGDGVADPMKERYHTTLPNFANILNCSYVFIFTMRLEDKPNPVQQELIKAGHTYKAVDEERLDDLLPIASLEVGLFINTFSVLCLENNIDVSFTGCFARNPIFWKGLPFVNRTPIIIMTAGKAKVYKQDVNKGSLNIRPNFERIVNYI